MSKSIEAVVGLDIGDRTIAVCAVSPADGRVMERATVATERAAIERFLAGRRRLRVVMETGTHAPWIARLLEAAGHEAVVADARRVKLITESGRKTDRRDAELLARLGRSDLGLLAPVRVRSEQTQRERALLRLRDAAVRARSSAITAVRGVVKSSGQRLPACDADGFATKTRDHVPSALRGELETMLELIAQLTRTIRQYDGQVETVLRERHAQTRERMDQVTGVGPLTALAVITAIEDPRRFQDGRQMAAYLGLVPRVHQSGASDPRLGISKAGDAYARRLLVSAAHYILERGPDTDLRRWGLALEARWGPRTRKRAAVAVARKLAVLLWRLWTSGERYVPLHVAA